MSVWVVEQLLGCLVRLLLLCLDLVLPWVFRRQRLFLGQISGCDASRRGRVRGELDRGEMECIHVGCRFDRMVHDFVAGHLDGSRVDLVVTPSRQLGGKLGHEANRVVGYLPAIEQRDLGRWYMYDTGVDGNGLGRCGDNDAVQLRGCSGRVAVDDEGGGLCTRHRRDLRAGRRGRV